MKSLRRTKAGSFSQEEAYTLSQVQEMKDSGRLLEAVNSVDSVFADCPLLHVRQDGSVLLENGNPIAPSFTAEEKLYDPGRWVRFYRQDESFAGIYAYDEAKRKYMPVKMFLDK